MIDLVHSLGAAEIPRDVVRVSGPDAVTYLQGQLSQDVEGLAVEATTWSFVLQPTGKVEAWCRVTRTADDVYVLDADAGAGEALVARLRRFLLRTKAEIEQLDDWRCVAVRGPGADETGGEAELRVPAGWPGVEGVDLLGPEVTAPPDLPPFSAQDYQALRIQSGVPAVGVELTDKTIPAEAGQWIIDVSVSFTKGCFTGQELVARIDSRGGNVPRHLRGLIVEGAAVPTAGASVRVGDAEVGTVTSAAFAPNLGVPVALAYIGRAVEVPPEGVDVVVVWADGQAAATLHDLPMG